MAAKSAHGERSTTWWDTGLFWWWIAVNAAAYLIIVVGGAALATLTSDVDRDVASTNRRIAVLTIAAIASAFYGAVLGRLQWQVLKQRMPGLPLKMWFVATLIPAFLTFMLVIGPEALDKVIGGRDPFTVYKDAFVQVLVLGPLIGASQAKALQAHTTRWKWWFVGNLTAWFLGASTIEAATWLLGRTAAYPGDTVSVTVSPAFPLLTFAVHGLWMLWITAPDATRDPGASAKEPEA